MNKKFFIILFLGIVINFNFAYGSEKCGLYDSIKIIDGIKAKKTSCSVIESREGDILTLNFTACDEVKFAIWNQFVKNNDIPLTNLERRNLKIPDVDVEKTVATFNNDNKFITITYVPYFKCSIDKSTQYLLPHIKIYAPSHFSDETNKSELSEQPKIICGDGTCNLNENCENCSKDCGLCPPTKEPTPPKEPSTQYNCDGIFSCVTVKIEQFSLFEKLMGFSIILIVPVYIFRKKIKKLLNKIL